jgi:hypothetical protein
LRLHFATIQQLEPPLTQCHDQVLGGLEHQQVLIQLLRDDGDAGESSCRGLGRPETAFRHSGARLGDWVQTRRSPLIGEWHSEGRRARGRPSPAWCVKGQHLHLRQAELGSRMGGRSSSGSTSGMVDTSLGVYLATLVCHTDVP